MGLRPKMYCLVDEKHEIHNVAKGVPWNVVIDGERMSVKNIEIYKRVLEAEKNGDAVIEAASNASTTKDSISAQRSRPRHS